MKICFVSPFCNGYFQNTGYGGAELQVLCLARVFFTHGHKVTIITRSFKNCDQFKEYNGVNVKCLPFRFYGGSNLFFVPDSINLIYHLWKENADYYFLKIPDDLLFQIGLMRYLRPHARVVKLFACMDEAFRRPGAMGKLHSWGVSLTHDFVFQTHEQEKASFLNWGIKGTLIRNIFIPPDSEIMDREKDIDILWVGAFNHWKAPEKLVELVSMMPEYKFTVISKDCTPDYSATKDQLIHFPNVDYLGTIPSNQMDRYYSRAKILISTSIVEGFPNSFLSAWYFKAPVISLTFSCDNLIQDESLGVVSGSCPQMVSDIVSLLHNEKARNEMGEKCHRYITNHHLPEIIYKEFSNAFFDKKR